MYVLLVLTYIPFNLVPFLTTHLLFLNWSISVVLSTDFLPIPPMIQMVPSGIATDPAYALAVLSSATLFHDF